MKNVFIINAHEPYPFSEGRLNRSLVERAQAHLENKGYAVQVTTMQDGYNVDAEIEHTMPPKAHSMTHPRSFSTAAAWMTCSGPCTLTTSFSA